VSNVFITGGQGYIGTATAELFSSYNINSISIDKKNKHSCFNIYKTIKLFIRHKPNAIIHLSAYKSIGESNKKPLKYYFNNVLSTLIMSIFSFMFRCPLVFASSAAVYNPNNPYAKAKLIEEKIIKLLCSRNVILRYFNIGGKTEKALDTSGGNIFSVIEKKINSKETLIINNPFSTRDYTHVFDIASINLKAYLYLKSGKKSMTTDVYSGKQYTILDLIKIYKRNKIEIKYELLENTINDTIYPCLYNVKDLDWYPTKTISDIIKSEIHGRHALTEIIRPDPSTGL
jgi:UDP-glucose 4-epimerase